MTIQPGRRYSHATVRASSTTSSRRPHLLPSPSLFRAIVGEALQYLWHRSGHPDDATFRKNKVFDDSNKHVKDGQFCHACQPDKHVRLRFLPLLVLLPNLLISCIAIYGVHPCLVSPGNYLSIIDDFSRFRSTFPLKHKFDVPVVFSRFHAYVRAHFGQSIRTVQCDNRREFNTAQNHNCLIPLGTVMRFS